MVMHDHELHVDMGWRTKAWTGYSRSEGGWIVFTYFHGRRVRVLGAYPDEDAALEAAKDYLRMTRSSRVCTPADIDRAREELAKAK